MYRKAPPAPLSSPAKLHAIFEHKNTQRNKQTHPNHVETIKHGQWRPHEADWRGYIRYGLSDLVGRQSTQLTRPPPVVDTVQDKQKELLSSSTGHFSLVKTLQLADYITEMNGKYPPRPLGVRTAPLDASPATSSERFANSMSLVEQVSAESCPSSPRSDTASATRPTSPIFTLPWLSCRLACSLTSWMAASRDGARRAA